VAYPVAMRLRITLGDDVVEELDRRVGSRRRSAFIAIAVSQALEDESRWESIESAIGGPSTTGYPSGVHTTSKDLPTS
jgi:metal-responsive CopG/Arc/MetJ family transcriptional regulator